MTPPLRALAAALATALLVACAAPPTPPARVQPLGAAEAGLAPADGAAHNAADSAELPWPDVAWWRGLGDPALDALIESALAGQPGLQVVAARLAQADAAAAAARAASGPQVGLVAETSRQRFSGNGLVPPAIAGSTRDLATLQANGRWSLDFFGRHDAALRAALGRQRAAAAELQAARVLLSAQLAQGWIDLSRSLALQALARDELARLQDRHALLAQRLAAGLDDAQVLQAAAGAVPQARQQLAAVTGQTALARHRLAVLAGQAPQSLDQASPALRAPDPATGRLGADLLGRRADVVAARWRVQAAAAQIDGARAAFYPDVDLTAFVGLSALGLDRLLSLGSRQLGAGPALRLPLFDGGLLRAELGARAAEADAAVAAYNGAVLQAAREAADAQTLLQSASAQQAAQAQVAAAAELVYRLAEQRHRAGLANRLAPLEAEAALLAQRGSAIELQALALQAQVSLVQALGGGWQGEITVGR